MFLLFRTELLVSIERPAPRALGVPFFFNNNEGTKSFITETQDVYRIFALSMCDLEVFKNCNLNSVSFFVHEGAIHRNANVRARRLEGPRKGVQARQDSAAEAAKLKQNGPKITAPPILSRN